MAKGFLILFTLLLGMFFLTIGYLFWKWMVLRGGARHPAVPVRTTMPPSPGAGISSREGRFAVSVLVIGLAQVWFQPARLAWFDTPLANMLRYEAIGPSGAAFELPPGFFARVRKPRRDGEVRAATDTRPGPHRFVTGSQETA